MSNKILKKSSVSFYCSKCKMDKKRERRFCLNCGVNLKTLGEQREFIEDLYKPAKESKILKSYFEMNVDKDSFLKFPESFKEKLDKQKKNKQIKDTSMSDLNCDDIKNFEKEYLQYFLDHFKDIEKLGEIISLSASKIIERKIAAFYNIINDLRLMYGRYKEETHRFYNLHCKLIERIVTKEILNRTTSDKFFQLGISKTLLNEYYRYYINLKKKLDLLEMDADSPIEFISPEVNHSIEHPHRREQSAKFLLDRENQYDWTSFSILFKQVFGKTFYITTIENTLLNDFWNDLSAAKKKEISWHSFYELIPNLKLVFLSPFPVDRFKLISRIKANSKKLKNKIKALFTMYNENLEDITIDFKVKNEKDLKTLQNTVSKTTKLIEELYPECKKEAMNYTNNN